MTRKQKLEQARLAAHQAAAVAAARYIERESSAHYSMRDVRGNLLDDDNDPLLERLKEGLR